MCKNLPLEGVEAIVLVGGRGTRLQGVLSDRPKPLAEILGRPFLYYLLDLLALRGAASVTLACGYMSETFAKLVPETWLGMPVRRSVENEPLGTGGALRQALEQTASPLVAVLNGDSFHDPNWTALVDAARSLPGAIALSYQSDASRYGTAELEGHLVRRFAEKKPGSGFVNAGVSVFQREWLAAFSPASRSLEKEMLPALAESGGLAGVPSDSDFYDIGTPESLAGAGAWFERMGIAPSSMFPDFPDPTPAQIKLGACAVILEPGSRRVLLERRADCGWWCLPGGRVEPGETVLSAALREGEEETGFAIKFREFLGLFSDPARRIVRYPDNGDLRHLVDGVIVAEPCGGTLQPSPESLDLAWFEPHRLPLNTVPPVIEILREAYGKSGPGLLR